jgi:hypothetical protein
MRRGWLQVGVINLESYSRKCSVEKTGGGKERGKEREREVGKEI